MPLHFYALRGAAFRLVPSGELAEEGHDFQKETREASLAPSETVDPFEDLKQEATKNFWGKKMYSKV